MNKPKIISKFDLEQRCFSDYLIRDLKIGRSEFEHPQKRQYTKLLYKTEDVITAIENKLNQPRLHNKTRKLLTDTLIWLEPDDPKPDINEVLKSMPFEQRMDYLKQQRDILIARSK